MHKIGKYEILNVLGEGGMGIVYEAFDPLMQRKVAIKVLSERVFDFPEIKERFYREARSAGQLSHENITIIHDLGETDGKPFIVMEYLTGTDLRAIIRAETDLSLKQKLQYAVQICRGLGYSHSKGIIHRDVKPENIRILDDGKVKVMDFGIAKPTASTMTQTGTVMGTLLYMSPEQIKGLRVDHRSDIFSFGVLLYELLTYKLPFPGESSTTVSYKIVYEEPEPIDNVAIGNFSALRQITLKCLAKEPDRRYDSLSEVEVEIEKIIRGIDAGESIAEEVQDKRAAETILLESSVRRNENYIPPVEPKKERRRIDARRVIISGGATLAVMAVVLYKIFFSTPAIPVGQLSLNILPWAEVTRIVNSGGEEVRGIGAEGEKILTPCQLSLPAGNYSIEFTNPLISDSLEISVTVEKGKPAVVTKKFPGFDYSEILSMIQE
jgi:serine/threonine protein kinase